MPRHFTAGSLSRHGGSVIAIDGRVLADHVAVYAKEFPKDTGRALIAHPVTHHQVANALPSGRAEAGRYCVDHSLRRRRGGAYTGHPSRNARAYDWGR
jgi:hypothetical protein